MPLRLPIAVLAVVMGGLWGGTGVATAFEVHAWHATVDEGDEALVRVVREPGDPDRVRLLPTSGTARAGDDFAAAPIEVPPEYFGWAQPQWFRVGTFFDEETEADETFSVRTEDGSGSAELTIHEFLVEGDVRLDTDDGFATPSERDGEVTIAVVVRNGLDEPLVVDYATADGDTRPHGDDGAAGGAGRAYEDYLPTSGRLTFPPMSVRRREVRVALVDDAIDEGSDPFFVEFTGDAHGLHRVFIGNDDDPHLWVGDAAVREGAGGTGLVFPMRISNPSVREHFAVMTTTSGRATEGADFVPTRTTVRFPPGVLDGAFAVPVVDDEVAEEAETMHVHLRYTEGLQGRWKSWADGLIADDDAGSALTPLPRPDPPALRLAPPRLLSARRVGVPVRCRAAGGCPVRLTLSFAAGATAASVRRTVQRGLRVAAQRRVVARVRVPGPQRRRLRRGKPIRVWATATAADGASRRSSTARLRLPASAARRG